MDSYIDDLKAKVKKLNTNPSSQLVAEIESLLRNVRCRDEIPQNLKGKLTLVINCLGETYKPEMGGDIPNLVLSVINKIVDSGNEKTVSRLVGADKTIDVGETAAEGQAKMNHDIRDKSSAFNILKNFGINPWNR